MHSRKTDVAVFPGENTARTQASYAPLAHQPDDPAPPRNTSEIPKCSILGEADAIAGQHRSRDYGHPLINHQRIADIWNVQIAEKLSLPLTPRDVALLMIGLKLAREVNTPKRDNLVDICGYVKCLEMMGAPEYQPKA